ncbi:MAG: hypothetical protein LBL07_09335 [Tannerella sp.]|jgi:hypothetical protein|nr:hypothetical protein [Tannerella sp.]
MMTQHEFKQKFAESIRLKDFGLLKSSLEKREEATKSVQNTPGYYSIGKANEAVLLGHHTGDGLRAYEATKEALRHVEAFAKADVEWKSEFGFSPLLDCFGFIGLWVESYEEAIQQAEQAEKWVSIPNNAVRINQLKEGQKSGTKWWEMQFAMTRNFYSLATQKSDAGKHAAGMSILHCIIDRAIRERPGYEMDENDLFDLLDDFLKLSLQAYIGISQKFVAALPHNPELKYVDGASEQFIVFLNPVSYWLQLMPDCPQKWKSTFQKHYEVFMRSPFPIYPELMKKIGAYFPESRVSETKSNSQQPPSNFQNNTSKAPKRGYAIAVAVINLSVAALFWFWAIKSNMKWYVVAIAVLASIFTLPALPQAIRDIFNKKRDE